MPKYYEIKYNNHVFHALVYNDKNSHMYRIQFGGKQACVFISIYENDPYPHLESIGYDKKCNLAGDLEHGKGTIDLLKAAMTFIHTQFHGL